MRERVRVVMRYAGPRMLLRHPILAILHLRDEKLPLSEKAQKVAERLRKAGLRGREPTSPAPLPLSTPLRSLLPRR